MSSYATILHACAHIMGVQGKEKWTCRVGEEEIEEEIEEEDEDEDEDEDEEDEEERK